MSRVGFVVLGALAISLMALSPTAFAKVRILDATSGLPANERAMVRVKAGKNERTCSFSAKAKRASTGTFTFWVSQPSVTFTWRVPSKAASLRWTATVRCAKNSRTLEQSKQIAVKIKVDGVKNGTRRLIKSGSLKVKSLAWAQRKSSVRQDPGGSADAAVCAGCQSMAAKDTYYFGYCTWYVATRRTDLSGLGNAVEWWGRTRAKKGSKPVKGAVAWWNGRMAGGYGHVAYVEQVSGSRLRVSEMNWLGWNVRSERWINLGTSASPDGYIYGGPAGNGPSTAAPAKPRPPARPTVPPGMAQASTFGVASRIAAGRLSDGRIVNLSVDGKGQMWEHAQTKANGPWKPQQKWGSSTAKWMPKAQVTMIPNADGRLQWFAVGADGQVWSQWRVPAGGWSAISPTGGRFGPGTSIGAGRLSDGRIVLLAVDTAGQMWERAQTKANGSWNGWQRWGGSLNPKWATNATVTMIPNADGRLQWFAVDAAGQVQSQERIQAGGWSSISGTGGKLGIGGSVAAGRLSDGRIVLLAVDAVGQMWERAQTKANGSWNGWQKWGSPTPQWVPNAPVAMIPTADGGVAWFAIQPDRQVWSQWRSAKSTWSAIGPFGGNFNPGERISATHDAGGRLSIFITGTHGQVVGRHQKSPNGSWNDYISHGGFID